MKKPDTQSVIICVICGEKAGGKAKGEREEKNNEY